MPNLGRAASPGDETILGCSIEAAVVHSPEDLVVRCAAGQQGQIVGLQERLIAAILQQRNSNDFALLHHLYYETDLSSQSLLMRLGLATQISGRCHRAFVAWCGALTIHESISASHSSLLDLALRLGYQDLAIELSQRGVQCHHSPDEAQLNDSIEVVHACRSVVGHLHMQLPCFRLKNPWLIEIVIRALGNMPRRRRHLLHEKNIMVYPMDAEDEWDFCTEIGMFGELRLSLFSALVFCGHTGLARAALGDTDDPTKMFLNGILSISHIPPSEIANWSGVLFLDVSEQDLRLNMAAIMAAIHCDIDLNQIQVDLDFVTRSWCWSDDKPLSPYLRCPSCNHSADDFNTALEARHMGSRHVSLLDVALLLGDTDSAYTLVQHGVGACHMTPEDLHCQFVWCQCAQPGCGTIIPAPVFASASQRQETARKALQCELRRMRHCHHQCLLALFEWARYMGWARQMGQTFRCRGWVQMILAFVMERPPVARMLTDNFDAECPMFLHTCRAWRTADLEGEKLSNHCG